MSLTGGYLPGIGLAVYSMQRATRHLENVTGMKSNNGIEGNLFNRVTVTDINPPSHYFTLLTSHET
jgi:hypothetical protein